LADDHTLMLESINTILAPHYEIVGTVADGRALVEAVLRLRPDLIILDITMPLLNGIDAAAQIKKSLPGMNFLFVTMHLSTAYIEAAFKAGGTGYVLKSGIREELLDAVQSVLNGRIYVSPNLSIKHLDWFQDDPATMDPETARILESPCHAHIVYPYSDDRSLVSKVGYYASNGLGRNGAVILLATEAHRYAIKRYLKAEWKVEALEASGQLAFFDAAEAMGRFMVNDNPDPTLFEACFNPAIEHAQRDERTGLKREVWLFGEMVDLLWPVNSTAAERLEELGNKLIKEYSIRILCAYSVSGPGRGPLPEALIKAHTHVIS
jgi:CheY-like chemotaxis protein